MQKLAFLVDACVDIRLARWLNERGHDAKHLCDEGLQRLPNGQIFSKAIAEDRIVVTHDLDFGEINAFTHGMKGSVIIFRLHNPRLARLTERLSYRAVVGSADGLYPGVAGGRSHNCRGGPPSNTPLTSWIRTIKNE